MLEQTGWKQRPDESRNKPRKQLESVSWIPRDQSNITQAHSESGGPCPISPDVYTAARTKDASNIFIHGTVSRFTLGL